MADCSRRFIAAAVIAAFALSAVGAAAQETDPIGVVVGSSGIVTLMRKAIPAMPSPGDKVYRGDRVITGPGARLRIAFQDAATVSIGPGSDIAFTRFVTTDSGFIAEAGVDLERGIVRSELPPSAERTRFEIKTPAAIVSARIADLIVEAEQASAAVFVLSGKATAAGFGTGDPVVLEQDFGIDVSMGGQPGAPKRWEKQRVARFVDLTALR